MAVAALITWVVTAGFGFFMLGTWLSARGAEGATSHFREPVIYGHFLLAAVGLVLWIVYLIAGGRALAWTAFALLLVVAVLGDTLFLRWYKDRQLVLAAAAGTETADVLPLSDSPTSADNDATTTLAEQRIPFSAAAVHGVFAVATVILVLLVALGLGS